MDNKTKRNWILDFFIYLPEIIAGIALVLTIAVTGVNVFTRYILKFTFFWYTDVTVLAFGWLVFMGCAAAYRRHMHFGIDILVNTFPKKMRAVFDVIMNLVFIAIVALTFYASWVLTKKLSGKQFPTILLSYKWYDAAMVAGFGLMTIYAIRDFVVSLINLPAKLKNQEVTGNE